MTTSAKPSRKSRPRGVGHARLLDLRDSLSERDFALLQRIDEHRVLSTQQVAALLFHDHATTATGQRVARRVLARLADHDLIEHLEQRIGGNRSGSSGLIWHLAPAGDRLLSLLDLARPRRRDTEPSPRVLKHSLAIGDVHVALQEAVRAGCLEIHRLELEPASWRRFSDLAGSHLLRPDLGLVTADPRYLVHWALEVDLGTEHPARLLDKCALYERYIASGQLHDDVAPFVVWIMDKPARAETLQRALRRAPKLDAGRYRVTTMDRFIDVLAAEHGP